MTQTENSDDKDAAKAWTTAIGQRMQTERKRRGITAQGLADVTERLGYPVTRNTIASLENGRKELLSIQELVVIARALEIAPIALMYPVDTNDDVRVPADPPVEVPAFRAARWFSGEYFTAPDVSQATEHQYGWGDYDENTQQYEGYTFPDNESWQLGDLRLLDRQASFGGQLCNIISNVQERFQSTHTPGVRDALRAELEILFTHVGRMIEYSKRDNTKLAKINAQSQAMVELESRYEKLQADQKSLDKQWSGGGRDG
jgi:transcriptional regulator with XRE-family HTH domain